MVGGGLNGKTTKTGQMYIEKLQNYFNNYRSSNIEHYQEILDMALREQEGVLQPRGLQQAPAVED